MRIATNTLYSNSLDTMGHQQSSLVDLQNQIATGKRVSSAADDPQAAAETVRLTQANAKLTQYGNNLSTAKATLQLQDTTLGNVTTLVQQAQTLINNAGDTSLDKTARSALALQIESVRDQLLNAGNATDSQGNYLFGGYETATAPFSLDSDGKGVYTGSQGQRAVQVNDGREIDIGGVGSKIFQNVSTGASRIVTVGSANAGSVTFKPVSTQDASDPSYDDAFSISFQTAKDGKMHFTIHDATSNTDVVKDQPYTPDAAVKFGGQSVVLSGEPKDGDTIAVDNAQSSGMDLFQTLTNVAHAIRYAQNGSEGNAKLTNALTTAGLKLTNSLDNVLTVQAHVGAREQEANTLATQATDTGVNYQTQLSNLTSTDFVSVYSQFSEVQNSLQAAEKTFMQVQNLSLFDLIK